jgi:hypothetical protein
MADEGSRKRTRVKRRQLSTILRFAETFQHFQDFNTIASLCYLAALQQLLNIDRSVIVVMFSQSSRILVRAAGRRTRGLPNNHHGPIRFLSAKQDPDNEKKNETESLEETVKRMKKNETASKGKSDDDGGFDPQIDGFLRKATDTWSTFSEEVGKTWGDLLKSGERKDINKKIAVSHPEDTTEGDTDYTGSVEIMIIDESEQLTAWERMQKRLTDAPIISGR